MLDGSPYDATVSTGYLLSASCEAVWDKVATQFADLMSDA